MKINKWIICVVVVVLLVMSGGAVYMIGKNYVNISGKHLDEYSYTRGGGMTGGYRMESVKEYDDNYALYTKSKANWYNEDPEVEEYLVDRNILLELETVVRKHRMNFWKNKKFTNLFIADGDSSSYSFSFGFENIHFSSQFYPEKYNRKLKDLDEVIEKYLKNAQKLPGLVLKRIEEDNFRLPENAVEMHVYTYERGCLGIKVANGTDAMIEMPEELKIINTASSETVFEENKLYISDVYPKSRSEFMFSVKGRLDAGNYKIVLGEYEIDFEIR